MTAYPAPDTVAGAFLQTLAPDQYEAMLDRQADRAAGVVLPPVPCPRGCGAPHTPGHQCTGGGR
jgi:hypothetical protein